MVIFHTYVSLPEGIDNNKSKINLKHPLSECLKRNDGKRQQFQCPMDLFFF